MVQVHNGDDAPDEVGVLDLAEGAVAEVHMTLACRPPCRLVVVDVLQRATSGQYP
jgi:hypothetical protein